MTRSRPVAAQRLAAWLLLEQELGWEEAQLFPLLFSPHPFYTVQVTNSTSTPFLISIKKALQPRWQRGASPVHTNHRGGPH
jgi:hypothetical protein